jgi:hypothetical protein
MLYEEDSHLTNSYASLLNLLLKYRSIQFPVVEIRIVQSKNTKALLLHL